ncbi:MAG TPA: YfcE family phosphodiesterase [Pyrodictium delaneyi]|uniref:YfcE family phosphodiesterase n=1 Tax=Pyrodictium delaneyi TaxID=1273541 RepID=A0A832ZUN0_9CREN|nr:YfcE family phosphodiesterase [Pyrodictium delaneyi]
MPGNCDSLELARVSIANAECIHMKVYKFRELVLAGIGGSIYTPFSTPFEYSEEEYSRMLAKLKEEIKKNSNNGKVVLVSHTPPYMSGLDRVRGGEYVGSPSLRKLVAETRPLLVVVGHIHEAWGVASVEGVLAVNPGPLKAGRYAIADIDTVKNIVRVRLARLSESPCG